MKNNSRGIITIDFLISLVIASTFCIVLFALTFTFTIVEVAQYAAFSTSRSHMAADLSPSQQEEAARKKFNSLITNNNVMGHLFKNGWFELALTDIKQGGPSGSTFTEYPTQGENVQVGVRLTFNAKLLSLNFSLLGSTQRDDNGFLAKITGLLIREPTSQECQDFFKTQNRYRAILALDPRFNSYSSMSDKYVGMEDNGC